MERKQKATRTEHRYRVRAHTVRRPLFAAVPFRTAATGPCTINAGDKNIIMPSFSIRSRLVHSLAASFKIHFLQLRPPSTYRVFLNDWIII